MATQQQRLVAALSILPTFLLVFRAMASPPRHPLRPTLEQHAAGVIQENLHRLSIDNVAVPTYLTSGQQFTIVIQTNVDALKGQLKSEFQQVDRTHDLDLPYAPTTFEFGRCPLLTISPVPRVRLGMTNTWCVTWSFRAVAESAGRTTLKVRFRDSNGSGATKTLAVNDSIYDRTGLAVIGDNPALLSIALLLLALVTGDSLLLLAGAVGSVFLTRDARSVFIGSSAPGVALTALLFLVRVPAGLRRIRPLIQPMQDRLTVKWRSVKFFRRDKAATDGPSVPTMADLRRRAERLSEWAMVRARTHFILGVVASAAGFIYLLRSDPEVHQTALGTPPYASDYIERLPPLLLFVASQLAARFFLQEYRRSLEDHRHFDKALRQRELEALIIAGQVEAQHVNLIAQLFRKRKRQRNRRRELPADDSA